MNIIITVKSRNASHHFAGSIHLAQSPDHFYLDPQDFYLKWGKVIPKPPHYEVKIVAPNHDELKKHGLHIHPSRKTGEPFMCYQRHIPTVDRACELFRAWCLGTVLKIVENIDMNTVYDGECGGDAAKFVSVLRERFGIEIIDEKTA